MSKNIMYEISKKLPNEILVQYSSGEDNFETFIENCKSYNKESGGLINSIILVSSETLSTYKEKGDNRHINSEMKLDDLETWKSEVKEIKSFISWLKKYREKEVK